MHNPLTCFYNQASAEQSVCRNPCVVFEALLRKQIPKFSRKTFAEAAAEGGNKQVYKRYSRKGFAEGVVSVEKLFRNKNQNSFGLPGFTADPGGRFAGPARRFEPESMPTLSGLRFFSVGTVASGWRVSGNMR